MEVRLKDLWMCLDGIGDSLRIATSFLCFDCIVRWIFYIFSSWFFGKITRKDAERLLKLPQSPLGAFLIRESETDLGMLLHSVFCLMSS